MHQAKNVIEFKLKQLLMRGQTYKMSNEDVIPDDLKEKLESRIRSKVRVSTTLEDLDALIVKDGKTPLKQTPQKETKKLYYRF